jgi:hypothetical protein
MKIWTCWGTPSGSRGAKYAFPNKRAMQKRIRELSETGDWWHVVLLETGRFNADRVCAMIENRTGIIQNVLDEYVIHVGEAGSLKEDRGATYAELIKHP